MFFYEGQFCPVCGKPFNESDDVVACPQCGCPHHRACWLQEGQCHFASAHGTPEQWAQGKSRAPKPQTPVRFCTHCGEKNPEFAEFCANCGKELSPIEPNTPPAPQYTPPVGNYTPPFSAQSFEKQQAGEDIPHGQVIDGVPVEEIMTLVDNNAGYYMRRFIKMSNGGSKVSWNWSAFLFSYNWLLYRKNVLWGILLFIFDVALTVINSLAMVPIDNVLKTATTLEGMVEVYMNMIQDPRMYLLLMITSIISVVSIAVNVLCGLFGNYLYMKNLVKKAKQLQQSGDLQYGRGYRKVGGTSFFLAIAPTLLITFVTYVYTFMSML